MTLQVDDLLAAVVQLLVLLLAISLHEAAHAWTAARCGDRTAAEVGRVTLNPIRHLDLFGSILVPLLLVVAGGPVFGWARPVPVRLAKLARPRRDHLLVTMAGPLANLALGGAALTMLVAALAVLGPGAGETARLSLLRDVAGAAEGRAFPLIFTLVQLSFLNGFLALFNLLPIPPLDGGQITLQLLPPDWAQRYSVIRPYGFMIVLGLAMFNLLTVLVVPVYVVIALAIAVSS
jgi:Zn-dependent protease